MNEPIGRPRLSAEEGRRLRVNLARVAGLAAGLGLLIEALLVVGGAAAASLSSLLDNGLWPFLVCLAVAVGQSVAGAAPPRAGVVAAVVTPVAFLLAKASQKGVAVLLNSAPSSADVLTGAVLLEAGLRAVEYAVLAAALAWLGRRVWAGALAYLGAGGVIGLVFGLLIAVFLPPGSLVGWVVEELVFPIGCALIIFTSETLTRLLPENTAPNVPL